MIRVVCIDDRAFIGGDRERGIGAPRPGERTHLILGKIYDVIAEERGMYRVVDESGDDFLYPKRMFRLVGADAS